MRNGTPFTQGFLRANTVLGESADLSPDAVAIPRYEDIPKSELECTFYYSNKYSIRRDLSRS